MKANKKNKKIKILLIILVIVIIVGGYFILKNIHESKAVFSIDNKEEAIAYAKTDSDFMAFVNNNLKTEIKGRYFQVPGIWEVVACVVEANDLCYQINFYPNGTIAFKRRIFA